MKADKLLLFTAPLSGQRILEAIFADRIKEGQLEVHAFMLGSTSIGAAMSALFADPDRPVAMVVNTDTEDPIDIMEDTRGPITRMFGRIAAQGWYLALAVPRLMCWATADPQIKTALESPEAAAMTEYQQSLLIGDLVQSQPFDVKALRKANAEFRGLEDYITRTVGKSPSARRRARSRTSGN